MKWSALSFLASAPSRFAPSQWKSTAVKRCKLCVSGCHPHYQYSDSSLICECVCITDSLSQQRSIKTNSCLFYIMYVIELVRGQFTLHVMYGCLVLWNTNVHFQIKSLKISFCCPPFPSSLIVSFYNHMHSTSTCKEASM